MKYKSLLCIPYFLCPCCSSTTDDIVCYTIYSHNTTPLHCVLCTILYIISYIVQTASVARHIYLRPGAGVGAMQKIYGGELCIDVYCAIVILTVYVLTLDM